MCFYLQDDNQHVNEKIQITKKKISTTFLKTDQSDECDGEKRGAENSQSACVELVDGPLFLRLVSRESPQQYTRLFTISTV